MSSSIYDFDRCIQIRRPIIKESKHEASQLRSAPADSRSTSIALGITGRLVKFRLTAGRRMSKLAHAPGIDSSRRPARSSCFRISPQANGN